MNVHLLQLIQNLMTALVEATWVCMGGLGASGFIDFLLKPNKSILIITKIIRLLNVNLLEVSKLQLSSMFDAWWCLFF